MTSKLLKNNHSSFLQKLKCLVELFFMQKYRHVSSCCFFITKIKNVKIKVERNNSDQMFFKLIDVNNCLFTIQMCNINRQKVN